MLREMRDHRGGPHLGMRALALVLALLLASPLTLLAWRLVTELL